jgi:NAD(P)-dependent dehydrogenase (short-subunit alcohol dehydrogenase family)
MVDRAVTNHTVVITGASEGIGRELALALAVRRANLVLAARGQEKLAVGENVRAGVCRWAGGSSRLTLSWRSVTPVAPRQAAWTLPGGRSGAHNLLGTTLEAG